MASCTTAAPDPTNALDLTPSLLPFDRNLIVDTASFTDSQTIGAAKDIQSFLEQTPYGHTSFLATYVSNGLRASEAILLASQRYQLNPIVFLVRAEMDGGLVAATSYPSSPGRVEYVFGCGCPGGGVACDPALGGFDRQVDCLGRELRASLSQICGTAGATAGGWSVGAPNVTLDGVGVTPSSEATAVLYQYTPLVKQGAAGGNWFFFNVWQLYSLQLDYFGSTSSPWVGDACCGDAMCSSFQGGTCAVNAPSGMCTAACSASQPCPVLMGGKSQAVCGNFGGSGYCLLACNPGPCRTGYQCASIAPIGGGPAKDVCLPGP